MSGWIISRQSAPNEFFVRKRRHSGEIIRQPQLCERDRSGRFPNWKQPSLAAGHFDGESQHRVQKRSRVME
jgi:hypothetical protein